MENKIEHCEEVTELGCGCASCASTVTKIDRERSIFSIYKTTIIKIILSIILIAGAFIVKTKFISEILYLLSALVLGVEVLVLSIKNIFKKNFLDENTLMLIASITAFVLGEFFEGSFIIFLFSVGQLLEKIATTNSKKKIAGLSKLKSTHVHLFTKNGASDVEPSIVEIGSLIEIRKGERVPIDGVLIGSPVELDLKAITGESNYYTVKNGETVLSGALNVGNPFIIRTTKVYTDSTVERIISLVEGSLSKKAKSQKFISSFARIYTPVVVLIAGLIVFLPPLIDGFNYIKWVYKALTFLVVSCPCALVISVPLAFYVGIGGLARKGIMVKGSNIIEKLTKTSQVVFDKTGTLTLGEFNIDKIETLGEFNKETVCEYIFAIESKSNHPLSKALIKNLYVKNKLVAEEVNEVVGLGVKGKVNGKSILVGNKRLMSENNVRVEDENYLGTVLLVAVEGEMVAKIYLSDTVKVGARESVSKLKNLGVKQTVILSGDRTEIVKDVANKLSIDKFKGQLLPEDKLNEFSQLLKDNEGVSIFVGDGINDTPTLSIADVGVAMGSLGSELASDCADVVIMDDDVKKLPVLLKQSKKIRRIVVENVIGSLFIKISVMILGVVLSVPVWLSMFADVGVMLLAICNSLRCSKV